MVKLNKYLREIGIDEIYWCYKDQANPEKSHNWIPDEEGFVPADFWNLDQTFDMYIYSHLCYFKEHCANKGIPGVFSYKNGKEIPYEKGLKRWEKELDDMIEGFKLSIMPEDRLELYIGSNNIEEIKDLVLETKAKSFKKFVKYYNFLWN